VRLDVVPEQVARTSLEHAKQTAKLADRDGRLSTHAHRHACLSVLATSGLAPTTLAEIARHTDSGRSLGSPEMRALRALFTFKLGAWVGMATAAAFVKRAVPSRGDEDSDELSLVAVFDGIELKSRAKAFRGGSMLAWFGGIQVDLHEAELAPGARLAVNALFGGIAIKTPPNWRIESSVKRFAGGVDARTPVQDDPEAPVLVLEGTALFGGIAVVAKTAVVRA
jgi:hypothetical protein